MFEVCTNLGCDEPAVATVPGYPEPLLKCFTHEREYADRYGFSDNRPLIPMTIEEALRA
jgi:hypothetical protein